MTHSVISERTAPASGAPVTPPAPPSGAVLAPPPGSAAGHADTRPAPSWPIGLIVLVVVPIAAFGAAGVNRPGPVLGLTLLSTLLLLFGGGVAVLNFAGLLPGSRAEVAFAGVLASAVGVPGDRLPHGGALLVVQVTGYLLMGLTGFIGGGRFVVPRAALLIIVMFTGLAVVSATNDQQGALKTLALAAIPSLVAFFLAGQFAGVSLVRMARLVMSLGLAEAVFAAFESLALKTHVWTAATKPAAGIAQATQDLVASTSPNKLLGGLSRAQGTLADPLPLGLLLLISLAFAYRLAALHLTARIVATVVLLGGVLFTGDRNSLLTAVFIVLFLSARRLSGSQLVLGLTLLVFGALAAVAAAVLSASAVTDFLASGSFTHRLGAFASVPRLLTRQSTPRVLFGNGTGAVRSIFEAGLLQTDQLFVVDNEYVYSLVIGGVVSVGLLVIITLRALVTGKTALRPAVLATVVTLLVFDTLLWPAVAFLTFMVLGMAFSRATDPMDAPTRVRDEEGH